MRLSFVGMSNIGKSSWAKKIAATRDCAHLNCDALIGAKLGARMHRAAFNVRELATWMGLPSEPFYPERSAQYLASEKEVMREILHKLEEDRSSDIILDTTGSVIYTGPEILNDMKRQTRVIYFEASEHHIEGLFKSYIANPKPVIWQDLYHPHKGETLSQTLTRCYPKLLVDREERYLAIADLTIPFDVHRDPKSDLISYIMRSDLT